MKRENTLRSPKESESKTRYATFEAVFDDRKRKVPGLWRRGSRFYVQLRVDTGDGRSTPRKIPLEATNLLEARAEAEKTRTEKRDGTLDNPGYRPKFEDFADEYLASPILAQKKRGTQENERQAVSRWKTHMGGIRLDKVTPPLIYSFREKRLAMGCSPRTATIDVIVLRNVLKLARQRGHIQRLPEIIPLKQRPPRKRPLVSREEFSQLLAAVTEETTKNADLFRFYLRFLALTGAREKEALRVQWSDVNFERAFVTIGTDGVAKNHKARSVNFSDELEALMVEMREHRPPDSEWLFPSPQRGSKDIPAKTLRESLLRVREAAKLPWIAFHDLRHFFASTCVMAGLDFMTIASWLGHSDGGILVGKVYGHLADSHKKEAARKLAFFNS
ncbi:MAG TPA: site-specific integrase [Chthoniobacter sp.]|jgi:integrase